MCGIVAILRRSGSVDPRLLADMRDALAHRGPDAATQWIEEGAGLAHRRLAVIDTTEASAQPMVSADGRWVLTYNGEIYNYVELREDLRAAGRVFDTIGDTEVLLQALEHWGEAALPRLNGMFAFALWDRRERRLLVARDRFGEKPLFMARPSDGGVAFASEIKALLRLPTVSRETDPETLAAYTGSAYYEEGEATMFRAVKRLPAAHALLFDSAGERLRTWRYWTPDYDAVDETITDGEAFERFHELLGRSVKMRLRADVRVGSSLSGGLDSSVVVGMLAQERDAGAAFSQDTFSARFPADPTMDEGVFIDEVIQATHVNGHFVEPTPQGLIDECRRLHWHQEEPFLSASIYLQFCVARLAKQNGTTVQLDGQGADELLGGYQYYFRQHQLDQIDNGAWAELEADTEAFNARMRSAAANYADSDRRFNAATAIPLEEIRRLRGSNEPQAGYGGGAWPAGLPEPGPGKRVRRIMAEAMQYNVLPQLLRYADRNSMAFSRESRLPFLDYDLVDFSIRLPDRMFFRDGWQKHILREAGKGYIPESVRLRADKVGYAAPLDLWMRGPLKDWCYERLFEGPIVDVPGYDAEALRGFWDGHQAGANNSWAVWRWISLNEWFALSQNDGWREGGVTPPQALRAADLPHVRPVAEPGLMARMTRRLFGR